MAATGEIPFGRYYGSVDSTPLFLWLYGRCVESTGDLNLANELWPNVERAIQWIERWGDRDGDGYVKYMRETPLGLANQGWKDSEDAVFHHDGTLARPPIALAEVQGYVYAACTSVASVAARLGHLQAANRLTMRAASLKRSFERDFWLEPEGMIALALDADGRPCRVMTSNGAHCLATGIIEGEHAATMCKRLLADDMYSGWGIRTLSGKERRYNPMSYHNGSVWPHDNAMAALGLARAGDYVGVVKVVEGLFDACEQLNTSSLPELFCGFRRETGLGPVPYPVACYPQAWSAASVFMLLQAMLGMRVLGFERRVVFDTHLIPSLAGLAQHRRAEGRRRQHLVRAAAVSQRRRDRSERKIRRRPRRSLILYRCGFASFADDVGVALGVGLLVGVSLSVGVGDGVGDSVGVIEGVGDGVGVRVGVGDGVGRIQVIGSRPKMSVRCVRLVLRSYRRW